MGANDAREQLEVCKDEYGKLERENAELRQTLVEMQPAEVLVEGSYFPVGDLPKVLGNFMRASAGYARDVKMILAERDAALTKVAELQAVIERVREVLPSRNRLDEHGDVPLRWAVRTAHDILSTSGTEALEARHAIKQIPPWSASPGARYLTGAFECSCGEKFLFLDSRHNPEWREDKRRIAEEHAALANRKTGEQSNGN